MKVNIIKTYKGILFLLFLFIFLIQQTHAFSISLDVQERSGVDRVNEPVTTGVPFSKEMNITSTNNLGVYLSDNQTQIPAQFRVLSRFDGLVTDTSRPIRVVLVDFKSDLNSDQSKIYYLKDTGSGTVAGSNITTDSGNTVTIETGNITLQINKTKGNWYKQIFYDSDSDHNVDDLYLSNAGLDGLYIVYNDINYTSFYGTHEVTIEENGPLKSVVKIKGDFEDNSNNKLTPPLGDTPISYTIRIYAYKDQSYIKVDFMLENENLGWAYNSLNPVHNIYIDQFYLKTSLNMSGQKNIKFDTYSDTYTSGNYYLIQDHKFNSLTDESQNFLFSIKKNGSYVINEDLSRYEGSVNLSTSNKGLYISKKWFWQNYPEAIEVNNDVVNYYFLPNMSYDHRILGGIWKTHTLMFDFYKNKNTQNEDAFLKKNLMALADDTYYSEANLMDFFAPENFTTNITFPHGEKLDDAINAYNDQIRAHYNDSYSIHASYPEDLFGLREDRILAGSDGVNVSSYGWLEFGDIPRWTSTFGHIGLHYDWSYASLLNFLRLKDYRMFDIGEEFVAYSNDILIIHDPNGLEGEGREYNGGHRYEWDPLMLFYDNYSASANGDPMRAAHSWSKGILLQYYLTGEERYKESLEAVGFHVEERWIKDCSCDTQDCSICTAVAPKEARNQGRAIQNILNVYQLTGNQTLLTHAYNIFQNEVLTMEGNGNEGWVDYEGAASNELCGGACDAHVMYNLVVAESLVDLYNELKSKGMTTEAQDVLVFLERHANWVKNELFTNWKDENGNNVTAGTYNDSSGEYFNYILKMFWTKGVNWQGTDQAYQSWSMRYAEIFALIYTETGNESWLNLSRNVFKDYVYYGDTNVVWTPIATFPRRIEGFAENPGSGMFKIANDFYQPMYYLRTEWELTLPNQTQEPPQTYHFADTNHDGVVSKDEVDEQVSLWKSLVRSMSELIDAIKEWKKQ